MVDDVIQCRNRPMQIVLCKQIVLEAYAKSEDYHAVVQTVDLHGDKSHSTPISMGQLKLFWVSWNHGTNALVFCYLI